MEYITVTEASEKWGISAARVRLLAKEGRIRGAEHAGKSWLIPATAAKPADGRTKASHSALQSTPLRFPLYLCSIESGATPPASFSDAQRQLFDAQLLVMACRYEEAADLLARISRAKTDVLVRAGVLHDLCICDLALGHASEFFFHEGLLGSLVSPRPEIDFLIAAVQSDLRALFTGEATFDRFAEEGLELGLSEHMLPFAAQVAAFVAATDARAGAFGSSLLSHEVNCAELERRGLFYPALEIHAHLAVACLSQGDQVAGRRHMDRAVDIAREHGYLFPLAVRERDFDPALDEALGRFEPAFGERVRREATKIREGYNAICRAFDQRKLFTAAERIDYEYVAMALQGMTNREMASAKGLSTVTVSKKISSICNRLGVRSKKELVEYAKVVVAPYE